MKQSAIHCLASTLVLVLTTASAQLLDSHWLADTFGGWVLHFHIRLLSEAWGQPDVLTVALFLLAFIVSGMVLWWPRRWSQGLALRLSRGRTLALADLHRVGGVVAAGLLLVSVITGVMLLYPGVAVTAVNALTGATSPVAVTPVSIPPAAGAVPMTLYALLQRTESALPGEMVTRIVVPSDPGPWVVRKRPLGDDHPNGLGFVRLDPWTGAVLSVVPWQQASPGVAPFAWVYPLHIGELGGVAHKVVLKAVGLSPGFLLIAGTWLWWRKRKAVLLAQTLSAPMRVASR